MVQSNKKSVKIGRDEFAFRPRTQLSKMLWELSLIDFWSILVLASNLHTTEKVKRRQIRLCESAAS
ncbi:hypothetical protein AGMMS49936_08680 [Endomicrobiia bacterium]|nr:hypothetical protein AGMMS49936_08680 [Endomicrobiia bacterium]